MENVEKIICCDRGRDDNALTAAILAGHHRHDDNPMAMAAMMGGGAFGANQWMNNPFAYMMMMAMFRMFGWNNGEWGNNGFNGQNAQNIELQNQIQSLRTQLQDNQNSNLIMEAIGNQGNRSDFALSQLSQNIGVGFDTLKTCCCQVQAAIQQVAGQVGFSAERVINAANLGDCRIIEALKDCCCGTKQLIQEMGYQNQLAQKDTIAAMQKGFCDLGFGFQAGFDRTNSGLERGFAQIGYDTQKQTCDIINAGNANAQRIIDTLNGHWNDENQRKIQDLKFELSQERQNNLILSRLGGYNNCGCNNGCGC